VGIKLKNQQIDVRVTRSKRKTMKMTVNSDGSVSIEAPHTLTKEQIMEMIERKKAWIISKIKQRLSAGNCYNEPKGVDGEAFSYLGRESQLTLLKCDKGNTSVAVKNGQLMVKHHTHETGEILGVIEKWYRQQTKQEVEFWLKYYQSQFETKPNRIVIKEQRRRWGSCSSKNNLNFNWRLSMMPTWVISYIVLHELCHFEEMNHSPKFWQAVERRMPEYNKAKEWLKENGHRFLPE